MAEHAEQIPVTAEEALYLLEAIACVFSEGWAPQVGPRFSSLTGDQVEALVNRVIAATGIDPANLRDILEM